LRDERHSRILQNAGRRADTVSGSCVAQGKARAGKIDTVTALQTMRQDGDVRQDYDERSDSAGSDVAWETGPHVVCTVAEGNYFNGLAALANSLVRAGFEGSIVVGYRGSKPLWADSLKIRDQASDVYEVTSAVHLRFVELAGTWHLANLKAHRSPRQFISAS
jgi:hypothetical protein